MSTESLYPRTAEEPGQDEMQWDDVTAHQLVRHLEKATQQTELPDQSHLKHPPIPLKHHPGGWGELPAVQCRASNTSCQGARWK